MNREAVVTILGPAAQAVSGAFSATDLETVAFGFAGRLRTPTATGLVVANIEIVPPSGYMERTTGHFRLQPSYVAEMVLRALADGRSLVLAHSHPGPSHPPDFSGTDARMHALLIPSLLRQIEGPVASLVWNRGGWNGRLWETEESELRVRRVRIAGRHLQIIRPRTEGAWTPKDHEPFARQVLAFGPEVQHDLGELRVGIVGLGGTGSLVGQWLAHLGVRDFVLIDPDRLDSSNLSRVVGSVPDDIGTPKTTIADRTIRSIRPDVRTTLSAEDVTACRALRSLRGCDLILSCTDSHASRAALNRLPYQYGVPLIDLGTLIRADRGSVAGAYADVRIATPGTACLRCQEVIDPRQVTEQMMSPEERALQARYGYVQGAVLPEPAVLPLNGVAVGLALLRLFDLLQPWVTWEDRVTIDLRTLQVVERSATPRPGCDVCGDARTLGAADDVALPCRASPHDD